jgi:hypothetical protein
LKLESIEEPDLQTTGTTSKMREKKTIVVPGTRGTLKTLSERPRELRRVIRQLEAVDVIDYTQHRPNPKHRCPRDYMHLQNVRQRELCTIKVYSSS